MFTYGLIFKLQNKIWLGLYDEEGNMQEGDMIEDEEGIYETLKPNEISFASIEVTDMLAIKDLQTITIDNEAYTEEEAIPALLREGGFSEIAKQIWEEWG